MTSSNGNIIPVTGPLCEEFTGPGEIPTQRPLTRSFDVFFEPRLYKRWSMQPWGWWFETPSSSLWRHCNGYNWFLIDLFQLSGRHMKLVYFMPIIRNQYHGCCKTGVVWSESITHHGINLIFLQEYSGISTRMFNILFVTNIIYIYIYICRSHWLLLSLIRVTAWGPSQYKDAVLPV